MIESTKHRTGVLAVLVDEAAHFIDRLDTAEITLALRSSPRKKTVAAQQNTIAPRVLLHRAGELKSQFEAGTLPMQPDDFASELLVELVELALAVCAGGDCNGPIGMEVVNMGERQERVQGRIDGCSNLILAECRERIVFDHLVFVSFTPVELL